MNISRNLTIKFFVFFAVCAFFVQPLSADSEYIVKKGDSLYKIARINKLSFTQLIALNPEVMGRRYIYPGQKIRVK